MTDPIARSGRPPVVLVTGGSGFIGAHLVTALAGRGALIVNLDKRAPALEEHRRFWAEADLADEKQVHAQVAAHRPGLIYNLAAEADIASRPEDLRVNVDGLRYLIEAAGRLASPPLVVHASTQLVAKPAVDSFDPRDLHPYTSYGESKAEAERYLHGLPSDVPWTVVRPTTVWGPYHPKFPAQIWRYLQQRLYLHPRGLDVIRSYGYVGNVVSQLLRIADLPPAAVAGRTFYLGDAPIPSTVYLDAFSVALSGKAVRRVPLSLLRLAALLGELSGRVGGPSPINLGRLHRMTSDYPVPMEPTFAVLGKGPYTFQQGVDETVAWLRSPSQAGPGRLP